MSRALLVRLSARARSLRMACDDASDGDDGGGAGGTPGTVALGERCIASGFEESACASGPCLPEGDTIGCCSASALCGNRRATAATRPLAPAPASRRSAPWPRSRSSA